ncbi:hypothetical protein [Bradyrhizobium jicamae]|uniref:hypothetical protein n=1 Tax=Bradyrhizobium jicamae TaxID=280332 RepID=UPI001BAB8668|nr:hypothetical protein [Bradyrhizobium jicamae]MBR0939418.1 hypothetical protein [Bradyrhizobium jicamae]
MPSAALYEWTFTATESVDGDSYTGAVVTADPTTYFQGETVAGSTVQDGGVWTYTITSGAIGPIVTAPGDPQLPAASGEVVVFNYQTANGYNLATTGEIQFLFMGGYLSGESGLGSESGAIAFNDGGSNLIFNESVPVGGQNAVSSPPNGFPGDAAGLMVQLPGTDAIDYIKISGSTLTSGSTIQLSDLVAPYTAFKVVADAGIGTNDFGQYNGYGNTLITQGNGGQIDFLKVDQSGNLIGSSLMSGSYWDVQASIPMGLTNFSTPAGVQSPALVSQSSSGQIDLLWFNYPAGNTLNNSLLLDGSYWKVTAAGNVTGDGHADLVTQSSGGQIDFLTGFSGTTLTQSALVQGSYWDVKGTVDLDHNGHQWLITQDSVSGQVDLLKFSGNSLVASDLLQQALPPIVSGSQVASNHFGIF